MVVQEQYLLRSEKRNLFAPRFKDHYSFVVYRQRFQFTLSVILLLLLTKQEFQYFETDHSASFSSAPQ